MTDRRDQLAEVIRAHGALPGMTARLADALAPVVDRMCADAAAEALEQAIGHDDWCHIDNDCCGCTCDRDDRIEAALRVTTDHPAIRHAAPQSPPTPAGADDPQPPTY